MDASDQPANPPAPPNTEPVAPVPTPTAAPAPPADPAVSAAPPSPPPPPALPPPVPTGPYIPPVAPTRWWHRRWVLIVGGIAAALVLLGVGWTAGYTMSGDDGGHRHSHYDQGPVGNQREFDGQRGFPGPQFGPRQGWPYGPPGPQQNQPTPQPSPSKSG